MMMMMMYGKFHDDSCNRFPQCCNGCSKHRNKDETPKTTLLAVFRYGQVIVMTKSCTRR